MRALLRAGGVLVALVVGAAPVLAFGDALSREAVLEKSLAAVGNATGDHQLVDSDGNSVSFASLRGRPLILSLVFTSCVHSCSVMTRLLARRVESARETLGGDSFRVLTLGFDTGTDTPQRMHAYARRQGVRMDGWLFASTDAATASSIMHEVGFSATPSVRGFDHIAQTTVLDGQGRVYRQIYGEAFELPALVEPLKELIYGGAAGNPRSMAEWLDGLRLLCTVYDPAAGRYRFDYSIVVTIATGVMCLGAVLVFLLRAWGETRARRPLRRGGGEARMSNPDRGAPVS